MFNRKKKIIRIICIVLCIMMVLGVFSTLLYTLAWGR